MKNLENYGVQELNAKEIRDVDGGDIGLSILAGLIIWEYMIQLNILMLF